MISYDKQLETMIYLKKIKIYKDLNINHENENKR